MGYIATDLGRVPSRGFDLYVFLLDDKWDDLRRRELVDNFSKLAEEVGPKVLVVQGAEPKHFTYEVLKTYGLEELARKGVLSLALLISDVAPTEVVSRPDPRTKPRTVVLHLAQRFERPGSLTDLLREVARAVQEPDAFDVLETMDRRRIKDRWGWISRYLELKPSFFGFGANLGAVVQDVLAEGSARKWRLWHFKRRRQ